MSCNIEFVEIRDLAQKYQSKLDNLRQQSMYMTMNESFVIDAEVKLLEEIIRDLNKLI